MVSLSALSHVSEDGVIFQSPYAADCGKATLLRPEDSILVQNAIGADIIMQLDDVISSASLDATRFEVATYRTVRWLDRCLAAHARPLDQSLFAIVQGGLDVAPDGLRARCLRLFADRDDRIPGYAIGGLAGGESKHNFWRVVSFCCKRLPPHKPRYLMGVGYPLDLVVCAALGVDLFDCVYPTRTARFGVALVDGGVARAGTLRVTARCCVLDGRLLCGASPPSRPTTCKCQCCQGGYSRAKLNEMFRSSASAPLAAMLLTGHNVEYMLALAGEMRAAALAGRYEAFARGFVGEILREGN